MNQRPRLVAGLVAISVVTACAKPQATPAKRLNVVVIGVDTLRADALGCYGAPGDSSPHLDRLAESGSRFTQATTAAPWTLPSFLSAFTGLYPEAHGVTDHQKRLAASHVTLAEALRDAGYETVGITGGGYVGAQHGIQDGFDSYHPRSPTRKFKDRVPIALDWLRRRGEGPFFLFLHAYDVHVPYAPDTRPDPPPGYEPPHPAMADLILKRLAANQPIDPLTPGQVQTAYLTLDHPRTSDFRRSFHRWSATLRPPLDVQWTRSADFDNEIAWAHTCYQAEVREMDQQVGLLLDALDAAGRLDDTLVLVVSDHGEAFMEHGKLDHGHIDEVVTRVPWIVHVPPAWRGNGDCPTVIDAPVRTIDLFATVLDYCGLEIPRTVQGRSLRPLLDGDELPPEPAACFQHVVGDADPAISIRFKEWKLLTGGKEGRNGDRLFHLGEDPAEREDRIAREPERAEELRRMLATLRRRCRLIASLHDGGAVRLDEAARRELIELGYVGHVGDEDVR